jgi:hypothetical protein
MHDPSIAVITFSVTALVQFATIIGSVIDPDIGSDIDPHLE